MKKNADVYNAFHKKIVHERKKVQDEYTQLLQERDRKLQIIFEELSDRTNYKQMMLDAVSKTLNHKKTWMTKKNDDLFEYLDLSSYGIGSITKNVRDQSGITDEFIFHVEEIEELKESKKN